MWFKADKVKIENKTHLDDQLRQIEISLFFICLTNDFIHLKQYNINKNCK